MTGLLRRRRPWAAIYRGPAAVPGCAEVWRPLLREQGLRTTWVGPGERRQLGAALREGPALLVHPGGGSLEAEWERVATDAEAVRAYVRGGGRYLGICLGGYLAGSDPGYALLPGQVDRWDQSGQGVALRSAVQDVAWREERRQIYVEDPPAFTVTSRVRGDVDVVARYPDGAVAALAAPHGDGRVVVCGPHPEAGADWFVDDRLPVPAPTQDLARELVGLALPRPD